MPLQIIDLHVFPKIFHGYPFFLLAPYTCLLLFIQFTPDVSDPLPFPHSLPGLHHFISPAGGPESEDVTVLLKALQKALLFEKEMQPRFQPTQVFFLSPFFPS